MKSIYRFLKMTLLGGVVIILPLYVTVVLVLKTLETAAALVQPISSHLPGDSLIRAALAVLVLLGACFAAGLAVRTAIGRFIKRIVEKNLLERVPGYSVFRGLTERFADVRTGDAFASALVVIEDALVPAFIVERHPGDQVTVFVPSAPTPAMGTVYILPARRVFELDVPLMQTAACVSKWGSGSAALIEAFRRRHPGVG